MQTLRLALDWTPNINHIGFFVAKEKGFYQELGLNVEISDPSSDNYAVTPAKQVELGQADMALCPTESIISYRTKSSVFDLIGIATIFQEDVSAIAVRADRGINSPKDMDGKSYASYQARYEDEIVKQMIRKDGGNGEIKVDYPQKLGIWDTLLNGSFDTTWIFMNWEGVEAIDKKAPLSFFKMKDYAIPYSYSPLIAASESTVKANAELYRKFLKATQQGFLYCSTHTDEVIAILSKVVPEKDQHINLKKALHISTEHFGNKDNWGHMNFDVVSDFLGWIYDHKLENQSLAISDLVTNEYLQPNL